MRWNTTSFEATIAQHQINPGNILNSKLALANRTGIDYASFGINR